MKYETTDLLRQLVPKSLHFDGYNKFNCPNSQNLPFFTDGHFELGDYLLTTSLASPTTVYLNYSSICQKGKIVFEPYCLTLDEFVEKLKSALKDDSDFITFNIQVRYTIRGNCRDCPYRNKDCQQMLNTHPDKVVAAVSFNISDIKEALSAMYFETTTSTTKRGGNIMNMNTKKKNGIFGMKFEFGVSKDPNIASTLMGVAVKGPDGSWYVTDTARNTRKNIGNMKLGNFPIMLLPTMALESGPLYKFNDSKYYYIRSVNPDNTLSVMNATDGMIYQIPRQESLIPGMTVYTKVVAFDPNSMIDVSSKENMGGNVLAAMCMMQWANGNNAEFSLDNIGNDDFNGLGALLPVLMATNGNNGLGGMFSKPDGTLNLETLMLLGASGNGDSNDMMQLLLLSQMLGGNKAPSIFGGATPTAAAPATTSKVTVVCEKCGTTYDEEVNFCSKCGGKCNKLATTCRKCGKELKKDAMFCHHCGTKAVQDSCPNCGKTIENDENFCSACGTNLKEPAAPVAPAAPVTPAEPAVSVAPADTATPAVPVVPASPLA